MEADKPNGTLPCPQPEMFDEDVSKEAVWPTCLVAFLALVCLFHG